MVTIAHGQVETIDPSTIDQSQVLQQYIEPPPTLNGEDSTDYEGAYNPFPNEETTSPASTAIEQPASIEQPTPQPVAKPSVASVAPSPTTPVESTPESKTTDTDPGVADSTDAAYTASQEALENYQDDVISRVSPLPASALSGQNNPALLSVLNQYSRSVNYRGVPIRIRNSDGVNDFYAYLNYPLAWTINGRPNPQAVQLLKQIRNIGNHALRPEMYHADSFTGINANTTILDVAEFDLILTDAFMTLKKHMTNGIVNPKTQFPSWNQPRKPINLVDTYLRMRNGLSAKNALHINNPEYYHLQRAYAQLRKNGNSTQKGQVIVPNVKMKLGSSSKAVETLRLRLGVSPGNTYDAELKQAVRKFQKNNGLSADGIVGRRTIAKLNGGNLSDANKLRKLKINMERARWQNLPQNSPYIWVNIPAFNMAIRQRNQTLFTSNVIVGKSKRKTPIFSDRLEYVVLNPYWNVPKTIFKEDKLPVLQRNPNAFKGMQVVSRASGKLVSPSAVNWKNGGEGYHLRQRPGPSNPLGRMKFLFPNRHAIYLHDTPKKHLFKKSMRTFSSGCVRVERALDLASFLLKHKGYNQSKIKGTWKGSKERWLNVKQSLGYPVHLSYFTAWANSKGQVRYSSDIYGYDSEMHRAYDAAINKYL